MERLFGEYLIKCKILPAPEAAEAAAAEESKEEPEAAAATQQEANAEQEGAGAFYPYEKISVEDALVRTSTTHLLVLFTAEYCPPCQGFM